MIPNKTPRRPPLTNTKAKMRNYKSPLFQHRHYAAIAKTLHETMASPDIVADFASMFAGDNPNFDRERFFNAARGAPNGKDKR